MRDASLLNWSLDILVRINMEQPTNPVRIEVGKRDLSPPALSLQSRVCGDKSLFPTSILLNVIGASERPVTHSQ
jgi:hypothetical protein